MNCKNCGKPVEGKYSKNKYCSQKCRLALWRKEHPGYFKKEPTQHICEICGATFFTVKSLKKYCSKKCLVKAETIRGQKEHAERSRKRKQVQKSLPTGFTLADWKAALAFFDHKCAYCRTPLTKAHREHFIPVTAGGGYTKDNIVPACPSCNHKKNNKNPIDWLASQVWGLIAYARVVTYLESQR
jgi:5-methylcytosine-specific restriction endonuclease McrA